MAQRKVRLYEPAALGKNRISGKENNLVRGDGNACRIFVRKRNEGAKYGSVAPLVHCRLKKY